MVSLPLGVQFRREPDRGLVLDLGLRHGGSDTASVRDHAPYLARVLRRPANLNLADPDVRLHESNQTWYCAVTRPRSGSMKWSRCDGTPDAAIESRAYRFSLSVLPVQ